MYPRRYQLFSIKTNPFILAGDLNAHYSLWESAPTENVAVQSIGNTLIENPDALLITPLDFGTRINESSGKLSTIDLIIKSSLQLALNSKIALGLYCGSDHLPVITTLNADPIHLASRPPSWIFKKACWPQWNENIEQSFSSKSFQDMTDPKQMVYTLLVSFLYSSKNQFRLSQPCHKSPKEPRRPWWNNDCQSAVVTPRRAEKKV